MIKPDDSSLTNEEALVVEERAKGLLDRASAWGTFPTPIEDLLGAAKLTVAPKSAFDAARIMAFLRDKAADVGAQLKSAISKVFGIYDAGERVIHIDDSVTESKQVFLKLHETGHHEMPTHTRLFRWFQECEHTLAPEIADQFEREANNFARFTLFQGDAYRQRAADYKLEIKTPLKLAKVFGASIYASAREFARTHHRACVIYVLEPIKFVGGSGAHASVRRVEPSPSFRTQFGCPQDTLITLNHHLGAVLPIGRKMTRPTPVRISDLNGVVHDCVAEAFDTTYNVIILLFPTKALSSKTMIAAPPSLSSAS